MMFIIVRAPKDGNCETSYGPVLEGFEMKIFKTRNRIIQHLPLDMLGALPPFIGWSNHKRDSLLIYRRTRMWFLVWWLLFKILPSPEWLYEWLIITLYHNKSWGFDYKLHCQKNGYTTPPTIQFRSRWLMCARHTGGSSHDLLFQSLWWWWWL